MIVDRAKLLAIFKTATVGTTSRELLEQSNSFVLTSKELLTFNGEILTRIKTPLEGIEGAVVADDLSKLLTKFPDEEVDISLASGELVVKGKRRSAGLTIQEETLLPYDDVPAPTKWKPAPAKLLHSIVQASRICGRDETQPRTTEVHIRPDGVEACDNFRLYQNSFETGVKDSILIPASTVEDISNLVVTKMSEGSGWMHFKTKGGHVVSIRSNKADYPNLAPMLKLDSPRKIVLPANLAEILGRADVMHESALDASVSVTISANKLVLKASKDSGWFKESKKVDYNGPPLRFQVHPTFLMDVLAKTRQVRIGGDKLKVTVEGAIYVVSLEIE